MPRGGLADDLEAGSEAVSDETTFARGSRVAVIRLHPRPHFEGWATVETALLSPDFYKVRFPGDPVVRERFIHPDWQADPERALALLQQMWRAEATPAIADFFPDDAS